MLTSEDALGNQSQRTYDPDTGNELSFTDPLYYTTFYGYDSLNRLVQVTDPILASLTYKPYLPNTLKFSLIDPIPPDIIFVPGLQESGGKRRNRARHTITCVVEPMSERVSFLNAAGETLAGDLELPPDRKPEHVVIVCHGFLGSRHGGGRAAALALRLAGAGYESLCFDFAGSGESGGSFASATLTKNASDLGAALDFLGARDYRRFIALGRSFGGNAVLLQAAGERRIEGVCLWSTPADMAAVIRRMLGEQFYLALLRGECVSFDDGNRTYAKEAGFL